MPTVKRRASKILNEYGAAQSDLIGKAVVLADGPTERQARSRTFGWMNCTGFGFRSKVMTEDGRSQPSSSRRTRTSHRLRAAQSARFFQIIPIKMKRAISVRKTTMATTSARRRGVMYASHLAKAAGSESFRLEIVSVPNADGAVHTAGENRAHGHNPPPTVDRS
jgi:hypothetical protein